MASDWNKAYARRKQIYGIGIKELWQIDPAKHISHVSQISYPNYPNNFSHVTNADSQFGEGWCGNILLTS